MTNYNKIIDDVNDLITRISSDVDRIVRDSEAHLALARIVLQDAIDESASGKWSENPVILLRPCRLRESDYKPTWEVYRVNMVSRHPMLSFIIRTDSDVEVPGADCIVRMTRFRGRGPIQVWLWRDRLWVATRYRSHASFWEWLCWLGFSCKVFKVAGI